MSQFIPGSAEIQEITTATLAASVCYYKCSHSPIFTVSPSHTFYGLSMKKVVLPQLLGHTNQVYLSFNDN